MRTNELMLYKHMEEGQILQDMTFLMENYQNDYYNMEDMKGLLYDAVNEILEMAVSHGFEGDLWHNYLTYLMASHENAYSTSCEIVGPVDGSINQVALHDFEIFKELFDYDFADLENVMGVDCISMLHDYVGTSGHGSVFNQRIRDRICDLSKALAETETAVEFKDIMTQFYKEFGVGKLGLHKAFRIAHTEEGALIEPITKIAHVHLDDLVGYEKISSKLIVSISRSGLMLPSTCTILLFSKHLTTCTIASTSRILARNWFPSPSPFEAPFTSPAISTNSIAAGMIFFV